MNPEKQGIGCVISSTPPSTFPHWWPVFPPACCSSQREASSTHHTSMGTTTESHDTSMSAFSPSDDVLTRPRCSSPRSRKTSERQMRLLCGSDSAGQKSWTTGTVHQPVKYAVFDRALHMSAYTRSAPVHTATPLRATHHHRNHDHRPLIINTTCSEYPFHVQHRPAIYHVCLRKTVPNMCYIDKAAKPSPQTKMIEYAAATTQ